MFLYGSGIRLLATDPSVQDRHGRSQFDQCVRLFLMWLRCYLRKPLAKRTAFSVGIPLTVALLGADLLFARGWAIEVLAYWLIGHSWRLHADAPAVKSTAFVP